MLLLFGGASPAFFTVIGLQILNINLARTTSKDHHSNGYAWISLEFFGWPPIGTYLHGYAQSGSAVYNFLFWPAVDMGLAMYVFYGAYIHDWTWMSI